MIDPAVFIRRLFLVTRNNILDFGNGVKELPQSAASVIWLCVFLRIPFFLLWCADFRNYTV